MFSSLSYGHNTASPNPLSLRHQLIDAKPTEGLGLLGRMDVQI
jgi:hypothetical protein